MHINGIRGISIHITESKIHISYLRNHDSTLKLFSIIFTCHPFPLSSISLLILGNTFSISSPFDVTKLQKKLSWSHQLAAFHSQCQWTCIFLTLTNPMVMRTQFGFKRRRESRYSSQCSWKPWFRHLSVNIFTGHSSFMRARGTHKRHHVCYYSYRVQN